LNDRQQSPLAGAIFKGEKEVVEALLGGGADPRVGQPSARDAVRIFGQEEVWGERMDEVAQRLDER
jgi:ankyrin repeat protein